MHIDNRGNARVDTDPNTIPELQSGHSIPMAVSTVDDSVWKFLDTNPAGSKWILIYNTVLDEDNFDSDADDRPPSQQSTQERIIRDIRIHGRQDFRNTPRGMQTNRNSLNISVINPIEAGDPLGISGILPSYAVIGPDKMHYSVILSGGASLLVFDPQKEQFIESIPTGNTLGGTWDRGFYSQTFHKIFFTNRNFNVIIYDIRTKSFEIKNSASGATNARCQWTNRDGTVIYGTNRFTTDQTIYKYDIEADVFSSFIPNNPPARNSNQASIMTVGIGPQGTCYIVINQNNTAVNTGGRLYQFNFDTEDFETTVLDLGLNSRLENWVWSKDRKTLWCQSSDTRYVNSGILTIDAENFSLDPSRPFISRGAGAGQINYGASNGGGHTNFYGGILGLDDTIVWMPSIVQGDDWTFMQADGSQVTETFLSSSIGITTRQGIWSWRYAYNGRAYSQMISDRMYVIDFLNKVHSPEELIIPSDSLKQS